MKVARWQLDQRQSQPLDVKIEMSKIRIRQWYQHWDGEVYVAFSGGLDSTALLHLVRSIYPDVTAIFCNTGLEYPEIVKFVKSTENVGWLRPEKRFQEVIQKYGWPVVSKRISQYVHEIRTMNTDSKTVHLRLTGWTGEGNYRSSYMLSRKWRFLLDAPFPISHKCCDYMKKRPAIAIEKQYGAPMLGMTTEEGDQRKKSYLDYGCNAYVTKRPRSWPIAFWKHEDVVTYLDQFDVPYSPIYDMGYSRIGCFVCPFGVHMDDPPNRFQRMKQTHPKLWTYCMDRLGLREVMAYIGEPIE